MKYKEVRVLHTAGAGVLLDLGKESLGIDLFSKDPQGLYPDTPQDLKRELMFWIEQGRIQTLVFTHSHGDHFCLEDVLEALHRNPKLRILSTEEVIRRIREEEPHAGRLYTIASEEKSNQQLEVPGFSLEVFNSRHMGREYSSVQNLVCMIQAAGMRILVPGDAWPEEELFVRVAKWSREIDLFLAPFPLIGIPTNRKILGKTLKIRQMFALHLPRPEADSQGWLASAKAVCARAEDTLPMPVFGETPGKAYYFSKKHMNFEKNPLT